LKRITACVTTTGALAVLGDYIVFLNPWGNYLETDRDVTSSSFRHTSFGKKNMLM
jgi:hypothetical protein